MVVPVSVRCDTIIVVSSRVVVISVETVCKVLAFNTSSCVSGDDGVPGAVDLSDGFPLMTCDATRVVFLDCMTVDAYDLVACSGVVLS